MSSLNDTATAALGAMPERIRAALVAKAGVLAAKLQAKIGQMLSGEVLQMKSGALAGSIGVTIEETPQVASPCASPRRPTSNTQPSTNLAA